MSDARLSRPPDRASLHTYLPTEVCGLALFA
jgi:hypothetical protein